MRATAIWIRATFSETPRNRLIQRYLDGGRLQNWSRTWEVCVETVVRVAPPHSGKRQWLPHCLDALHQSTSPPKAGEESQERFARFLLLDWPRPLMLSLSKDAEEACTTCTLPGGMGGQ